MACLWHYAQTVDNFNFDSKMKIYLCISKGFSVQHQRELSIYSDSKLNYMGALQCLTIDDQWISYNFLFLTSSLIIAPESIANRLNVSSDLSTCSTLKESTVGSSNDIKFKKISKQNVISCPFNHN